MQELRWEGRKEAAHVKSCGTASQQRTCAKALSAERVWSSQGTERSLVRLTPREGIDEAGGMWPYKGWCLDLILSAMENHWKI